MGSIAQGFERFNNILIDRVKDYIKDRKDKDPINRVNTAIFVCQEKKLG